MLPSILSLVFSCLAVTTLCADEVCSKCDATGKKMLKQRGGEIESTVTYCSESISRDRKSRGLGWVPCTRCGAPEALAKAEAEFEEGKKQAEAWLDEMLALQEALTIEAVHIETEHFRLTWDGPKFKTKDRKSYDKHRGAHLYAKRLEEFYDLFQSTFEITDKDCRVTKHHVVVVSRMKDVVFACEKLLEVFSDTSAYKAGDPSIFVAFYDKGMGGGDLGFHRHLVHMMTHLLAGSYHFMRIIDEYGFLHEGLAHWFEMKVTGSASNSCNREQVEEDLSVVDFEGEAKRQVMSGKAPQFAEFCKKRTPDLEGDEHAIAWSMTDFLMHSNPVRTRDLLAKLKRKEPLLPNLKSLFAWNATQFQKAWEEYVKDTYNTKAAGRRRPGRGR